MPTLNWSLKDDEGENKQCNTSCHAPVTVIASAGIIYFTLATCTTRAGRSKGSFAGFFRSGKQEREKTSLRNSVNIRQREREAEEEKNRREEPVEGIENLNLLDVATLQCAPHHAGQGVAAVKVVVLWQNIGAKERGG
ncbi:hypothetical protein E2C01_049002 [Portunus trituberculatus]|uniref:Uncharacterized protein n=1 Tax=Portunus trituberculatus TaxID=210409 RepID=A0A5B7GBP7_PORTR|nr:hypothetical protein [Portunus trituberculatus]